MKGHPDNVSPIDILQDRLKMIDHYIYRLEKSGNTGTKFLNFYKNKAIEFKNAIEKLEGGKELESWLKSRSYHE